MEMKMGKESYRKENPPYRDKESAHQHRSALYVRVKRIELRENL